MSKQAATASSSRVLLRNLPIVVGVAGSGLLVLNRLLAGDPSPAQTRADALGIALAAVLVLVGLLWQQVQPPPPEEAPLTGSERFEVATAAAPLKDDFRLLAEGLIGRTRARSLLVWRQGKVLLRAGTFEGEADFIPGAIAERVLETARPVYLVDLKHFPGRVEFACLPQGTAALVCQPLAGDALLIVGAATARPFSPQELGWIESLAAHLGRRFATNS